MGSLILFQPSASNAVVQGNAVSPEIEQSSENIDRIIKQNKRRRWYV
jgi:hypothetical protein